MEPRTPFSLTRAPSERAPRADHHRAAAALTAALLLGTTTPVLALDGCQVLLCLAAPSWRAIPQCVPPITQLGRDLARGKPSPSCRMAGGGNSASHAWANPPSFCPPQYTRIIEIQSGTHYSCDYAGAVSITVDGQAFARTWWTFEGGSVTYSSPAAKAILGSWDTRFDDEYASWLASQPPALPVEPNN